MSTSAALLVSLEAILFELGQMNDALVDAEDVDDRRAVRVAVLDLRERADALSELLCGRRVM